MVRFPASAHGPRDLRIELAGFEIAGCSIGAVATAFALPRWRAAVDMGRCSPLLAAQETVLLTHCHSDHVAGLVAWLSAHTRRFEGVTTRLLVPAGRRGELLAALEVWPDLDGVRRRVRLEDVVAAAHAGQEIDVEGGWARPFEVEHSVPSLGWAIGETARDRPRIVVAGDGTAAPFRRRPELLDADVAVVEATFVEPGRRIAAHLSAHAHLQDWLDLRPDLPCDHLVLAHLPAGVTRDRMRELLGELGDGPEVVPWVPP